ncbi:MAG: FKBP-type peptidyl-prolyl cis-trans isomerase [Desulfobulbaceae bacterium]|nr:FKBP-type peptidyl-prolyl cis-trans isomerase [Desulfobulbaceae bacterium]
MRYLSVALLAVLLWSGNVIAEEAEKKTELETFEQKLSYAFGLDLGSYFKNMEQDVDLTLLYKGILASYNGEEPLLSKEEAVKVQQTFAAQQQEKQMRVMGEKASVNKKKGKEFLDANKKKEGVKETASGLQYKVVKEGTGAKPSKEDTVVVHYKGTLMDGTEFDSSYKRGKPLTFPLNRVIPGWTEALQLMSVGSVYQVYLSSELGYGDRGAPPAIEPGSLLIFDIELIDIGEKAKETTAEKK